MKPSRSLIPLILALGLSSGRAHAAPNPPGPITLTCPTTVLATGLNGGTSVDVTLKGDATWRVKAVHKYGFTAFQVRRNPGATSDLLWCDYRGASDESSAVSMQMSAVTQAPADHPKCTPGGDLKSFTCRALGQGESY